MGCGVWGTGFNNAVRAPEARDGLSGGGDVGTYNTHGCGHTTHARIQDVQENTHARLQDRIQDEGMWVLATHTPGSKTFAVDIWSNITDTADFARINDAT